MEVRFEDLCVSATATPAGRVLPSIFNSYRNFVEVCSASCHPGVSGIIFPHLNVSDVQVCLRGALLAHLLAVLHMRD